MLGHQALGHRAPRRGGSASDGFTLVELVVAMMIIGSVLLGLLGLQVSALATTAEAKQRQQATAIANETIEKLRALPYDVVTKGVNPAGFDPATYVVSGHLVVPANGIDEELVQDNAGEVDAAPLAGLGGTNVTTHVDQATNRTSYTAHSYVSRTTTTANAPLWLTVVVTWLDNRDEEREVVVRSQVFSPDGCLDTDTRPFSGPCQDFLYATTQTVGPSLALVGADGEEALDATSGLRSLSVDTGEMSTGSSVEQTASATARLRAPQGVTTTNSASTSTGGLTDSLSVGDDPTVGDPTLFTAQRTLTQPSGTAVASGAIPWVEFSLADSAATTGSLFSSAKVRDSSCADPAGIPLNDDTCTRTTVRTGRLLASAEFAEPIDERTLGFAQIAQLDGADGTAWAGRYLHTTGTDRCTSITGAGCTAADGTLEVEEGFVGGLPAISADDIATPGYSGLIRFDDIDVHAENEYGTEGAGTPALTRTGSIRVWDGAGYSSLSFTDVGTYDAAPYTARYWSGHDDEGVLEHDITLTVFGSVTIPAPVQSTIAPTGCTDGCTTQQVAAAPRFDVTYLLELAGSQLASWRVSGDLGQITSVTTYKAGPQ